MVFLIGCATDPAVLAARQAKLDLMQKTTPVCEGKEDCIAKWDAAQVWVVRNSGYKIQTATSALIETYSPAKDGDRELAAQVIKEPIGGG